VTRPADRWSSTDRAEGWRGLLAHLDDYQTRGSTVHVGFQAGALAAVLRAAADAPPHIEVCIAVDDSGPALVIHAKTEWRIVPVHIHPSLERWTILGVDGDYPSAEEAIKKVEHHITTC